MIGLPSVTVLVIEFEWACRALASVAHPDVAPGVTALAPKAPLVDASRPILQYLVTSAGEHRSGAGAKRPLAIRNLLPAPATERAPVRSLRELGRVDEPRIGERAGGIHDGAPSFVDGRRRMSKPPSLTCSAIAAPLLRACFCVGRYHSHVGDA